MFATRTARLLTRALHTRFTNCVSPTRNYPDARAELEILRASKKALLEEMERDPEVATQFLKDIGLLDAEGNRVVLPGEEHLHPNSQASNGNDEA